MALVVVVSGVALVLDKLWLDAAQLELNTAVEAAALSSGRALVSDDLLRGPTDNTVRLEQARHFAADLAAKNRIAGQPVALDPSPEGSIRFGKLVYREDIRETVFVETTDVPTTVVVTGEHSHTTNNPVALFWQGIAGVNYGNVFARSEASIDNHVAGFRPIEGVPVPVLPLAILKQPHPDANGETTVDDWETQIEKREGEDLWRVDPVTHRSVQVADGIPEITLRTIGNDGDTQNVNAYFFVLDPQATLSDFEQHLTRGWLPQDFKSFPIPELRLDQGPLSFQTLNSSGGNLANVLQAHQGECRIVFLFDQCEGGKLVCSGVVAGRIMSANSAGEGACQIVFQPGVLTTRTAILVNETLVPLAHAASANKYVYKLHLTF